MEIVENAANCGNIAAGRPTGRWVCTEWSFYSESEFPRARSAPTPAFIHHAGPRSEIPCIFHNFHNFHNYPQFHSNCGNCGNIHEYIELWVKIEAMARKSESLACLIMFCFSESLRCPKTLPNGRFCRVFQKLVIFPQFPQLGGR